MDGFERWVDVALAKPAVRGWARVIRLLAAVALMWLCALSLQVALTGNVHELRLPFLFAAAALGWAGVLCILGRGLAIATGIVAALTAAAFAVSLAEFTIREADDPTRYRSLWVPCLTAFVLGLIRLSSTSWRDDT